MQSLKPKGRYFRGPVTGDRSHSPPDASMKPLRGYSDNEHREFTQRSPVTGRRIFAELSRPTPVIGKNTGAAVPRLHLHHPIKIH